MGANQFNGATKGNSVSNGNLYLFRLADTYLLRAEAKFYHCLLYTSTGETSRGDDSSRGLK